MRLQQRTVGGRDSRDSIAMLSSGLERVGNRVPGAIGGYRASQPGTARLAQVFAGAGLTYFSRRICAFGRPAAFNAPMQLSTMSGLPHR